MVQEMNKVEIFHLEQMIVDEEMTQHTQLTLHQEILKHVPHVDHHFLKIKELNQPYLVSMVLLNLLKPWK